MCLASPHSPLPAIVLAGSVHNTAQGQHVPCDDPNRPTIHAVDNAQVTKCCHDEQHSANMSRE